MKNYYNSAFKNIFNFSGKSSLNEYLNFVFSYHLFSLYGFLPFYVPSIFKFIHYYGYYDYYDYYYYSYTFCCIYNCILSVVFFLPALSMTVRRLNHMRKSPLYILLLFIPAVGLILFLPVILQKGDGLIYIKDENGKEIGVKEPSSKCAVMGIVLIYTFFLFLLLSLFS